MDIYIYIYSIDVVLSRDGNHVLLWVKSVDSITVRTWSLSQSQVGKNLDFGDREEERQDMFLLKSYSYLVRRIYRIYRSRRKN